MIRRAAQLWLTLAGIALLGAALLGLAVAGSASAGTPTQVSTPSTTDPGVPVVVTQPPPLPQPQPLGPLSFA